MKLSIAIPFHDTPNTTFYLARLLKSIEIQTFKDYEIVLTKEGAMAHNHNEAILKSKGEIVQMMQMDDYFTDKDSLQYIVDGFNRGAVWQITSCWHLMGDEIDYNRPHIPEWTDDIYTGNNRLGSISTLSFRNDKRLLFEEPLSWLVDVDLYYRYFLLHGKPNLLGSKNVVVDTRNDRLSHTLSDELKANEVEYLRKKYEK
jgi:hypothetical protein